MFPSRIPVDMTDNNGLQPLVIEFRLDVLESRVSHAQQWQSKILLVVFQTEGIIHAHKTTTYRSKSQARRPADDGVATCVGELCQQETGQT